jgi:spermidine synthase
MASDSDAGPIASSNCIASPAHAGTASPASDRRATQGALKLLPIVAASGFAGLGYEIVWARILGAGLGTEMTAVLGSVAGFFAGLALGAFTLDAPIRRSRSPRVNVP